MTELRAILNDHADTAFVDDGCDQSAIAMATAIAAQDMGNARQAIDLLRAGGEVAKRREADAVTDAHIEAARELVQRGWLKTRIRDQTDHAQYILETIAHLEENGETPVRSKRIREKYESVTTSWAADPLTTLKSIQDHPSDLHMLGFLRRHERNQGLNGGQYFEYELDLDSAIVLETRQTIEEGEDLER